MKAAHLTFSVSFNLFLLCAGRLKRNHKDYQEHFLKNEYSKYYTRTSQIPPEVCFKLYTRDAPDEAVLIEANQVSLHNSTFDPTKPTRLMTHGFWSSSDSDTSLTVKNSYLKYQDVNVILVDWAAKADTLNYISAAQNTIPIGRHVAELLDALVEYGARPKTIHLVGHSLGAHISGFAGKYAKQKVARITGLDPAGPLFETFTMIDDHLAVGDAEFLDVIHTSAGYLGYKSNLGDVDFYPNDGEAPQPGCKDFLYAFGSMAKMMDTCSHGRSWEFFADSINPQQLYISEKCRNYNEYLQGKCSGSFQLMGEYVNRSAWGTYYLTTNSQPSYAQSSLYHL